MLFLAVAFLCAVALNAAFVWFYNRALSRMHESDLKKFVALCGLPLGTIAGALLAWRAPLSPVVLALAGMGAGITLWYALVAMEHRRMARGARVERLRPAGDAVNWRKLSAWARPIMRAPAPLNDVSTLRVITREVAVRGLPPAFDGYRIVHLTDIHIHKTLRDEWFRAVLDEAQAREPDVLLFGGDFISKWPFVPRVEEFFAGITAPDGVWFVRGNHDFWKSPQRLARLARRCGMRLLSNEGATISRDGRCISLVGLESPYVAVSQPERDALGRLPHPRVALVHNPEAFAEASALGCVLALAGHTHGGQVRLPLFGTTLSGTSAGPRLASGAARVGRMLAITSTGQGAFFPFRFLCPPELHVIVLRRVGS